MALTIAPTAEEPMHHGLLCPEELERIFQRVEAESERRAELEDEVQTVSKSNSLKRKSRRRASVSISRFGQLPEDVSSSKSTLSPPQTPNILSTIAAQSSLYQSPMNNQSTASVASDSYEDSDAMHLEDEHHVTQIHQIAPRQTLSRTVGEFLSRRTRSRSGSVLSSKDGVSTNMMIGVSVVENTVDRPLEADEDAEELQRPESRAFVSADSSTNEQQLKRRSSKMNLNMLRGSTLVEKAKGFGHKLRARSRSTLLSPYDTPAPLQHTRSTSSAGV